MASRLSRGQKDHARLSLCYPLCLHTPSPFRVCRARLGVCVGGLGGGGGIGRRRDGHWTYVEQSSLAFLRSHGRRAMPGA